MKRVTERRQSGAILAFALLLLLVLTLLGMAGIRPTLYQGEATRNHLQRQLAFENAEIALREGEARLDAATGAAIKETPLLPVSAPFNDQLPRPEYRLKRLETGSDHCSGRFYRVTAQAKGSTSKNTTVLQSIFYIGNNPGKPECKTGRIAWTQIK